MPHNMGGHAYSGERSHSRTADGTRLRPESRRPGVRRGAVRLSLSQGAR